MKTYHWLAIAGIAVALVCIVACTFVGGFLLAKKVYTVTPDSKEYLDEDSGACEAIDHPHKYIGVRLAMRMRFDDVFPQISGISLRSFVRYATVNKTYCNPFFSGDCGPTSFKIRLKIHKDMELPETQLKDKVQVVFYFDGMEWIADTITR